MTFKDYMGKELSIGDKVVFITHNYRTFSRGTVVDFTKMFVRIEYPNRHFKAGLPKTSLQSPDQLLKIEDAK